MEGDYILVEWSEVVQDWCLFKIVGNPTLEQAAEIMEKNQAEYPEKEFKFDFIPAEDSWWNIYGVD